MYYPPKNDWEYSGKKLDLIMMQPRLRLNPFRLSDDELMEYVYGGEWGGENDIVQNVVIHFIRLREVRDNRRFDGIYYRIGNRNEEYFITAESLIFGVRANDSKRLEHSLIGSRPIKAYDEVASLVGRRVFVSRIIHGENGSGKIRCAYKMHLLYGEKEKDAGIIRTAMCKAKVEML